MTLREALVILDLSERTLEPSMLDISLKNRLEKTDLRNVTRVLEAYRKVNSFLNPTLDTAGDSKGTVIDEPIEDGPPIQTTKAVIPSFKTETGLRRDYVPAPNPNVTLLGSSDPDGNSTIMIDPDDTPHQSNNPKQTSIMIDDWVDAPLDPAPRAVSRQLAPLAIVGLSALAFAAGLGGMAVVSKIINPPPPPSINATVTDPVDPNTLAVAKPSNNQVPNSSNNFNPEITNPTSSTNTTPTVTPSQNATTPSTNTTPSTTIKTPEIPPQGTKPPVVEKPVSTNPNANTQALALAKAKAEAEKLARAKAAALEKAKAEKVAKAKAEKLAQAKAEKLAQAKAQAEKIATATALEQTQAARLKKARQAQLEKARLEAVAKAQAQAKAVAQARAKARAAEQAQTNTVAQARAKARAAARAKAAEQARINAAGQARANAATQARAKARAAEQARTDAVAQARAKARAEQRARAAARAKARAQAQIRSQTVVNSSARNLANNRSQFNAWDRNGAVLRYSRWSQIPQSIQTARAGSFRAAVFVAASPSAMPNIRP